jgi:hypothetical protein
MLMSAASLGSVVPFADCESLHEGLLRQPVNARSSLALLGAGAWILVRAARRDPGDRIEMAAFGGGLVIVGAGSVILHGPAPAWGLWFHDLSVLSVLLLLAVRGLGRWFGWDMARRLLVVGAGIVLLAIELAALPASTLPTAWVLVLVMGLGELADQRRRLSRPSVQRPSSSTRLRALAAATVAIAGGAYVLGRSGSPLCDPQSLLQWHAVWHVLVAISAVLAAAATDHDPAEAAPLLAGPMSEV